uniref:RRM domain-containing protein n=1 Tax=Eutreptiella gymnastica TaxID=73025 RepID=A0A7S4G7D1_9EUGL
MAPPHCPAVQLVPTSPRRECFVRRREEAAVQQMTTELERMKARKDRLLRAKESRREAPSPPPRAPAASPPRAGKGKGGAYRPRSRTPPPRNRSPPPPTHAPPRTRSPPPPTHAAKRRNISTERPRDESAWDRRDFGHRYVREEPKREEPKPEQNVSLTLSGLEGSTEAELKANVEKLLQEFESRGTIPRVQSCDTDAGKVTVKVSVPGARRILTELTTTKVTLVRSNLPSLLAQLQETVSIKLWRLPKNATVGGLRNILEEFGQPTDVWVQDANDIGDWPYLCGRVTFDSPSACRRAALGLHLVKHYPGAPCSMVVSLPRETFGIGSSVLVSMPKGVQSDQLKDVMSSVGKVVSISQFPDEKDDAREKAVVVFKHPGDAKDACKKLMPKAITVQKPDVNKDLM